METVMQKSSLKDGYYYSGYILQTNSVIANAQPTMIAMWDAKELCFLMWDDEGNRKSLRKIAYLNDLDNEIEGGFYPIKCIIPKEDQVID